VHYSAVQRLPHLLLLLTWLLAMMSVVAAATVNAAAAVTVPVPVHLDQAQRSITAAASYQPPTSTLNTAGLTETWNEVGLPYRFDDSVASAPAAHLADPP